MKLKEKKKRAMASNFRGQGLLDRLNGKHVIVLKVVGLAYFDSFFNTFCVKDLEAKYYFTERRKAGSKRIRRTAAARIYKSREQ